MTVRSRSGWTRLVDIQDQTLPIARGAADQVPHPAILGHDVIHAVSVALPVAGVDGFLVELRQVDPARHLVGFDRGEGAGDASDLLACEHTRWAVAHVYVTHWRALVDQEVERRVATEARSGQDVVERMPC